MTPSPAPPHATASPVDPPSPDDAPQVPTDRLVVDERPRPRSHTPRILVTNDDGFESPGIIELARSLAETFDVVVAAPDTDMSGTGTGIGRFDPATGVALTEVDISGVDAAYAVAGPPGLAVMAGALGAFGERPDLVVSGVNAGMNTGHSIIHSGTVGGALTARTFGSHGIAVSIAESDPWQWQSAVAVAGSAVEWMLRQGGPRKVLNVNVPALPIDQITGVRWADMDAFGHFRVAVADLPGERLQFEMSGTERDVDPASDTAICRSGAVSLTLISSLAPAPYPSDPATDVWAPPG